MPRRYIFLDCFKKISPWKITATRNKGKEVAKDTETLWEANFPGFGMTSLLGAYLRYHSDTRFPCIPQSLPITEPSWLEYIALYPEFSSLGSWAALPYTIQPFWVTHSLCTFGPPDCCTWFSSLPSLHLPYSYGPAQTGHVTLDSLRGPFLWLCSPTHLQ